MSHRPHPSPLRAAAAALLVAALSAQAQQQRQPAAPQQIDWTKAVPSASFKGPKIRQDSTWKQRTPRIYGNAQRKEQEWGVFDYAFDTIAPWTDNMTATFYVLLDGTEAIQRDKAADQPVFTLLQLTLRYGDIQKGKDHKISAVLLPAALERYGKPIGLGLVVTVNDVEVYVDDANVDGKLAQAVQMATKRAAAAGATAKPKWWEFIGQVIPGDKLARRNDYLVDRAKTPFALVAIDDYVPSK